MYSSWQVLSLKARTEVVFLFLLYTDSSPDALMMCVGNAIHTDRSNFPTDRLNPFLFSPWQPHPNVTSTCVTQVHGRTVSSKKTTQGAANWDIIRKVKDAVSIPVVANGGIETGADAERLLEETGADAVMSSEGLLENPALFDRTIKPMEELQGVEVGQGGALKIVLDWFP